MQNKHFLAGLLAVTTVITTIAVNPPSSYAGTPKPTQVQQAGRWVWKNGKKVWEVLKPKRVNPKGLIGGRRQACKLNPNLPTCSNSGESKR
jgi:hypothetical protein